MSAIGSNPSTDRLVSLTAELSTQSRKLGPWPLAALVVASMIGAGV
jgi:hypothetical protein